MKRNPCWPFTAMLLCLLCSTVSAQGLLGPGSLGLMTDVGAGPPQTISPFVRAGVEWVNLRFDMDGPGAELTSVGFRIKSVPILVGAVGIDWNVGPRLGLTLVGAANAQRSFYAETGPDVLFGPESAAPGRAISWQGSELQWRAFDGSLSYLFSNSGAAIFGVRWDHFSSRLGAPELDNQPHQDPLHPLYGYRSDFDCKTLLPYFGWQVLGPNWKAKFIGSPFINARLMIPYRVTEFAPGENEVKDNRFSMNRLGWFLEGNFEYWFLNSWFSRAQCAPVQNLNVGIWIDASMLKVKNQGIEATAVSHSNEPSESSDGSDRAVYSRSMLGFGVSGCLYF